MAKLTKRKGKNNWEISYPLSKPLRTLLKTPAIYRSLGTPDEDIAARLYPAKLHEIECELRKIAAQQFPDIDPASLVKSTPQQPPNTSSHRTKGVDIFDLAEKWRREKLPSLSLSTQEDYERHLCKFLNWSSAIGLTYLEEVTRDHVHKFVTDTYHGNLGKSVKVGLGVMQGLWDHAVHIGKWEEHSRIWRSHDYPDHIRIGTGEAKDPHKKALPFSPDDIRILLRDITPHTFCDVFKLGLISGIRCSECLRLSAKNISGDEDGFWIHIPATTDRETQRSVPIPTAFTPFINRLLQQANATYLFPLFPSKTWPSERERCRYINKELNRKRRALHIPHIERKGLGSIRKTYLDQMKSQGIPQQTIRIILGHKTAQLFSATEHNAVASQLRDAAEALLYPHDIVCMINLST